ncbi:Histidine kinase-, DNA gyrase B-, and HSP90-like ATPase [Marinobacter subterrani]|uniref:Histidine kinase-, DNA gyrase B-, and HSP90-like ATPase n=1 Tax=Marinobacter subterrani TaxID=1658765 RepID=A0A0J7JDM9_9GAMM|nr:Histidine kinase-, DNA gyrase B-, and HSP90-like ATPase [Marinobacter subterrani]
MRRLPGYEIFGTRPLSLGGMSGAILGNLLDNAGKWSTRCVELSLKQSSDMMQIMVTDDGAGVDPKAMANLGQRGLRLDE